MSALDFDPRAELARIRASAATPANHANSANPPEAEGELHARLVALAEQLQACGHQPSRQWVERQALALPPEERERWEELAGEAMRAGVAWPLAEHVAFYYLTAHDQRREGDGRRGEAPRKGPADG